MIKVIILKLGKYKMRKGVLSYRLLLTNLIKILYNVVFVNLIQNRLGNFFIIYALYLVSYFF